MHQLNACISSNHYQPWDYESKVPAILLSLKALPGLPAWCLEGRLVELRAQLSVCSTNISRHLAKGQSERKADVIKSCYSASFKDTVLPNSFTNKYKIASWG